MKNDSPVNTFINEIDSTIKHLEEFGDVVYTSHMPQINKIINAYNKLKSNIKE